MTSIAAEYPIVVIWAGQAGFELCAKLRLLGVKEPIALIGDEDAPPYQRPPLSKAYLLGDLELERLFFRPRSFYEVENIDLRTGCSCTLVDRDRKTITLSDGSVLGYQTLVFATGAAPIRLPDAIGGDLKKVHYVRTLKDADAIAEDFKPGKHALIIGGGYIGLEAAAVASGLGMKVTLVEATDRILARVAAPETSTFFCNLHTSHGVDLREGVKLIRLIGEEGSVTGAVLSDGTELKLDVAVVGIGIRPNQKLAETAGLECENGIKVDALLRSSDPNVFAIGDCASFPYGDARIRLESVGNAIDQAQTVANVIAGKASSYAAKPWFWSDQYDVKLQIVGLSTGYDWIVTRGHSRGPLSYWYYADDKLLAVDAINDPRAYMVAKRLIENGKTADPEIVADIGSDLKTLLNKG